MAILFMLYTVVLYFLWCKVSKLEADYATRVPKIEDIENDFRA